MCAAVANPPVATFEFPSANGVQVTAYRWDPAGKPVGIAQITHGMGEHALRYGEVAASLNGIGLVVYAQDHRGHGATASTTELGLLGDNGWDELVSDIGRLTDHIRTEHPDLPLALIGHSMGSFAVQQYLIDNSDRVTACALSGTAAIDLLAAGLDLDVPLDLAAFNAPFEQRTGFEWLSRDPAQVDLYVEDPLCGFGVDAVNGKAMFLAAARPADPTEAAKIRHDLPLYITVGTADPVNGAMALIDPLVERYKTAGLTDVTLKAYDEGRHEVFNETNREEVLADLSAWIAQALKL
ncbi:MAG TPA: alpha/beta hydrolase [Pseudonocardia sp.]|jgi:alpha-beta hydrolase superfamily lysophospholipase